MRASQGEDPSRLHDAPSVLFPRLIHPGTQLPAPHKVLRSGEHSSAYSNCFQALKYKLVPQALFHEAFYFL